MHFLRLPRDVSGPVAQDLVAQVRALSPGPLVIAVDTNAGDEMVWDLVDAIAAHEGSTTAIVGDEAQGAGLILTVACQHRACQRYSRFAFQRFADEEATRKLVTCLARWRIREVYRWYFLTASGKPHRFGADEARTLGVVQEIIETPRETVLEWRLSFVPR